MSESDQKPFDETRHEVERDDSSSVIFYVLLGLAGLCVLLPTLVMVFLSVSGYTLPQVMALWRGMP